MQCQHQSPPVVECHHECSTENYNEYKICSRGYSCILSRLRTDQWILQLSLNLLHDSPGLL